MSSLVGVAVLTAREVEPVLVEPVVLVAAWATPPAPAMTRRAAIPMLALLRFMVCSVCGMSVSDRYDSARAAINATLSDA